MMSKAVMSSAPLSSALGPSADTVSRAEASDTRDASVPWAGADAAVGVPAVVAATAVAVP